MSRKVFNASQSPDPESAQRLYEVMSGISQRENCSGWLTCLEYVLWSDLSAPVPKKTAFATINDEADLIRFGELSRGWIVWKDDYSDPGLGVEDWGPYWVPIDEWENMYSKNPIKRGSVSL